MNTKYIHLFPKNSFTETIDNFSEILLMSDISIKIKLMKLLI